MTRKFKPIPIKSNKNNLLFSLGVSDQLSQKISNITGLPLNKFVFKKFANSESLIYPSVSVRGADVFIVHSTPSPVNENFMNLLIAIDACHRASAHTITIIMPYFGYMRQDRKTAGREPITVKLIVNLLETAGMNRFVTIDVHSEQTIGFFKILSDNINSAHQLIFYLSELINHHYQNEKLGFISPDFGGVKRVRHFAHLLLANYAIDAEVMIMDKKRPAHNVSEIMTLLGDAENKTCFIFDDIIDTGGTLCEAIRFLRNKTTKDIHAVITHAVLSDPAVPRINQLLKANILTSITVLDTIDNPKLQELEKCNTISVASLLAKYLKCVIECKPLSDLHKMNQYQGSD